MSNCERDRAWFSPICYRFRYKTLMNRVAREMNDGIAAIGSEPRKHRICDSRRDGAAGISEHLAQTSALLPSSPGRQKRLFHAVGNELNDITRGIIHIGSALSRLSFLRRTAIAVRNPQFLEMRQGRIPLRGRNVKGDMRPRNFAAHHQALG